VSDRLPTWMPVLYTGLTAINLASFAVGNGSGWAYIAVVWGFCAGLLWGIWARESRS